MPIQIIIGFIGFLVLIFLIEIIRRKWFGKYTCAEESVSRSDNPEDKEFCCGKHEVCAKYQVLKGLKKNIEYYDDEELDAYKGKASNQYTEADVEVFREIVYSMRENDIPGWTESLKLREIQIPDQLRDEIAVR